MDYLFILYIIFGLIPSLAWLFYYLRKDVHPESKKMILIVFFWGAVVTLPVFFVQIGMASLLALSNIPTLISSVIYWFLIIAFTEELFKYFIIKFRVLNNPEFDEPVDAMIYMIVIALGFAAFENILYLFVPSGRLPFSEIVNRTVIISFVRFIGATFLHSLCSGVIGYFLALSIYNKKRKWFLLLSGIFIATVLHGFYDFSIITVGGPMRVGIPVMILIVLALFVFSGFSRLRKIKSICLPRAEK